MNCSTCNNLPAEEGSPLCCVCEEDALVERVKAPLILDVDKAKDKVAWARQTLITIRDAANAALKAIDERTGT